MIETFRMAKRLFLFLGLISTASCISFYDQDDAQWNLFKEKYNKEYSSKLEESFRRKIYIENQHRITKHNLRYEQGVETYFAAVNEFSDELPSEFLKTRNGIRLDGGHRELLKRSEDSSIFIGPDDDVTLPESIDWREKGAVTPVKNQGKCGSCWAFSATGSLEGQHFRQTGKLVSLSEQNLVDCSVCHGCNGGSMVLSFKYVKDNHGIDTEESYPYQGKRFECRYSNKTIGAEDKGYVLLPNSEAALKKAVATIGPISVSMDASDALVHYKSGVFSDKECRIINHGALVVGYGRDKKTSQDYWIVKNSWGENWGMEGYFWLLRGKNMCLISFHATYPLV